MSDTETYEFSCRCSRRSFEISEEAPPRSLHMLLGVVTLGGWLVLYAVYRMVHLWQNSKCPKCGKRSRLLLWLLIILGFFTIEVGRTLHYFLISAPQQIVTDVSFANLPEGFDPNAPLQDQDMTGAIGFVWAVAALPMAGVFIATYWPYIILFWLGLITIIGLAAPSFYLRRE